MTVTKKTEHNKTYGGELSIEDFNTYKPNKQRINNQSNANNLHEQLKINKKQRSLKEMYSNYTLEELREMKLVSNTNGRPTENLTDKKWQKEFLLRKLFIIPHNQDIKKLGGKYSKESGLWNSETNTSYDGCNNWQQYCSYINDVLNNIRSGQVECCYYIYQIIDLIKFHYKTLRTKYCNGYWEVWLER